MLELVRKGRRNIALFDAVRFWAYRAHKTDYTAWLRAVEARTLIENRRFPEPLTERHARPRRTALPFGHGRRTAKDSRQNSVGAAVSRAAGSVAMTTARGTLRSSGVGRPASLYG